MLIEKKFQGTIPENKISDMYSESKTDTYSCDYINNLKGKHYEYSLTTQANVPNGSWQALSPTNVTTDVLPKGKYLILFEATVVSGSNGVTTFNPYLDGDRTEMNTRTTVPLAGGLNVSGISSVYKEFTEDSKHTINIYGYSNVYVTSTGLKVEFIKL